MINKRPNTRSPEATRRALLAAAGAEFSRLGFDGARTRTIADAAGVNQALIRYHFGGKAGLYREVVADAVAGVRDDLERLRASKEPSRSRFSAFVQHLGKTFEKSPQLPAMLLREYLDGGERLTPEIMAEIGEFFATTKAIVTDGIREGEFRKADPHSVHLSLIGSLTFFLTSRTWRDRAVKGGRLPASAPTIASFVRHTERLILDGLTPTGDRHARKDRR